MKQETVDALIPMDPRPMPECEEMILRQFDPFARRLARRMERTFRGTADREDLEQVARIGLLQAARRYDPSRRCQFTTFAFPTIVGEMYRYLRDRAPAIQFPRRWFAMRPRLLAASEELAQTLGREPTTEELALRLGIKEEEVGWLMTLRELYRPACIDQPLEGGEGEPGSSLAQHLGASDPDIEATELRIAVRQLVDGLPPRLATIVRLRYLEGQTQQQVAQHLGYSQMHISRLEKKALAQLRTELHSGRPDRRRRSRRRGSCSSRIEWATSAT